MGVWRLGMFSISLIGWGIILSHRLTWFPKAGGGQILKARLLTRVGLAPSKFLFYCSSYGGGFEIRTVEILPTLIAQVPASPKSTSTDPDSRPNVPGTQNECGGAPHTVLRGTYTAAAKKSTHT